eukprot:3087996-Amphidinium_carterae.1
MGCPAVDSLVLLSLSTSNRKANSILGLTKSNRNLTPKSIQDSEDLPLKHRHFIPLYCVAGHQPGSA